jgi:hypothetical protein
MPAARTWTPPPRPEPRPDPAPAEATRPAARPSKDDLAALDALLNARTIEGPLAPLERAPVDDHRWTPQFGHGRGAKRAEGEAGGGGRRWAVLGGSLLLLGAAAAGAYWYLNRPKPGPPGTLARATPAPSMAPTTTLPAAVPATAAPPSAAPRPAPSAVASAAPPPPTPAPERAAAPADLNTSRALLRQGRLDEAARGFAGNLRKAPASTFSVQLLVACSPETVQKALASVNSPELFIVPVHYQGRDCFRMCWGLYPSGNRALSAARTLPEYFRASGVKPKILATGELLP